MNDINKILDEYRLAVKENIDASKTEVEAKDREKKAHYRLLKASELLRDATRQALEDTIVL